MNKSKKSQKKFLYDKKSEWGYISKKDINVSCPHGYKVIGEVSKRKPKLLSNCIENDKGVKLYYSKVGDLKKGLYITKGYIPTNTEDEFIEYKVKNILAFCIAILMMLGITASIVLLMNKPMQIDPNIKDFDPDIGINENLGDNSTIMPGFQELKMIENTDEIYVSLGNPKSNKCYFQYTILLEKTNEELFSTELIPPGKGVTTVKLPRTFKSGTYPIIIKIRAFHLQDRDIELNGSEFSTNIVSYQKKK